jgi:hypothetical protein
VTIFRAIEALGKKPSNGFVFRTARGLGYRFTENEGKALLSKFRSDDGPTPPLSRPALGPVSERQRSRPAPEPPLNRSSSVGASRARGKGTPSTISSLPDVDFGELEPDAALYVANAAAENKTGRVTSSRTLSLRRELYAEVERAPSWEAFAYGLRAANAAGAANPRYVRKAAAGAKRGSNGRAGEPEIDYPFFEDLVKGAP